MKIKFHKKRSDKYAAGLQDAYNKGYFQGSIDRDDLMTRITRYHPELRWIAHEKVIGLHDVHKGFVCGIARTKTIPMFSIFFKDDKSVLSGTFCDEDGTPLHNASVQKHPDTGKMLARGWAITIAILERKGYKVDTRDLSDSYFWEWKWKD